MLRYYNACLQLQVWKLRYVYYPTSPGPPNNSPECLFVHAQKDCTTALSGVLYCED